MGVCMRLCIGVCMVMGMGVGMGLYMGMCMVVGMGVYSI